VVDLGVPAGTSAKTAEAPVNGTSKVTKAAVQLPAAPTTPQRRAVSHPSSPTSSREASSSQVLHSGVLKKHHTMTKTVNKFELVKEDDRTIAIFYANTAHTSPSSAKNSSSFYLAGESYIESKSKTSFTVHQLKSGGKRLTLEAKSIEERVQWIQKIQEAIDSLKAQNK